MSRSPLLRMLAWCAVAVVCALAGGCSAWHTHRRFANDLHVHTFRHDYANTHLVAQRGNLFLVDSGLESNARRLDDDIRGAGYDPARLRAVIVTHGHADHAGGARFFQQRYGTPVVAGAGDSGMFLTGRNEQLCATDFAGRRLRSTYQYAIYTPTAVNVPVSQPMALAPLTGIEGQVVPVPGHTPGSLVVVVGEAAFVGDMFRGGLVTSGASEHFYMCDLDDNRRDVHWLLSELAPSAQTFFAGHFGPVTRDDVVREFGGR